MCPWQTTLPCQTQGAIDPCQTEPDSHRCPWVLSMSLGSWTWHPLGPCRTDHLWHRAPAVSGTLCHDRWGSWRRGKICIPSACSCHNEITETHGGEGVCLRRSASCHLISQPSSSSLGFPASSRREPASPSWKENSLAETEWVQWFKWRKSDSCQWKRNELESKSN